MVATGATSGAEALELVRNSTVPFDLVLLDMFMPGLRFVGPTDNVTKLTCLCFCSGAETCVEMRKIPAYFETPIICVTASDRPSDSMFTDYLGKPFLPQQIASLLEHYLPSSGAE